MALIQCFLLKSEYKYVFFSLKSYTTAKIKVTDCTRVAVHTNLDTSIGGIGEEWKKQGDVPSQLKLNAFILPISNDLLLHSILVFTL